MLNPQEEDVKVHFLCSVCTLRFPSVFELSGFLLSFSDSPDVGQAFVILAGGGRKAELLSTVPAPS